MVNCDLMTFVSLWPIIFLDRMKIKCSLQRLPHVVVLGLLNGLICDWLKIPISQKSFLSLGLQMLYSVETSDSQKDVCIRRLPG